MKVIDLFCGAGGFSEGFRQAGFEIIWAVDKWQPAVTTHHNNHPHSNTILGDVEQIAHLPDNEFDQVVPDSEIIIGSPPCVDFSNSNKSGKSDKVKGIRLIEAFLRIVARKMFKQGSILKYWILENVPNVEPYVEKEYPAARLNLNGDFVLYVNHRNEYNAQNFGVPSKRKRFICGEYPEPQITIETDNGLIPLKHVLSSLGKPQSNEWKEIRDPNYDFAMLSKDVTDHHYFQELAEFEWKKAQRLKQDKGYMGRMAFPEDTGRPARTIMATMSFSARESMIFGFEDNRYRAPTIREVASLMSFPIDYRFYGESIGQKYKLVGNAVPPKMAFAFAKAIANHENIEIPAKYLRLPNGKDDSFVDLNWRPFDIRKEIPKRPVAGFKYHIPYLRIRTYRVELTNHYSDFEEMRFRWDVEIHKSQGPDMAWFTPKITQDMFSDQELRKIENFYKSIREKLTCHNEFQRIYCMIQSERLRRGFYGPYELLERVRDFLNAVGENANSTNDVLFDETPFALPRPIALGYFVLQSIIREMEDLSKWKRP